MRRQVEQILRKSLPDYDFKVVRKMPYREYRQLCSDARFALTFGEGLDGCYVESIFSGAISATVFNDRFLTEKYRALPFVYSNWSQLLQDLPGDLRILEDEQAYGAAQRALFDVAAGDYQSDEYIGNLLRFYREGAFDSSPRFTGHAQ